MNNLLLVKCEERIFMFRQRMRRQYNRIIMRHNKGVSLVEILVAFAVGMIVLSALTILIQQSVKGYQTQTTTAQLQNDGSITISQMEESVMGAEQIAIYTENGEQSESANTEYFMTRENTVYRYDSQTKRLYLANGISGESGYSESLLCENVMAFHVKLFSSSILYEASTIDGHQMVNGINKPVRVEISITLGKNQVTRQVSKEINVRNKISKIALKLADQSVSDILQNRNTYEAIKAYIK